MVDDMLWKRRRKTQWMRVLLPCPLACQRARWHRGQFGDGHSGVSGSAAVAGVAHPAAVQSGISPSRIPIQQEVQPRGTLLFWGGGRPGPPTHRQYGLVVP